MSLDVLHVIPAIAPRYGGPSAAVLGMCRALDRLGARATIATTDADGGGRLTSAGAPASPRIRLFPRQASEAFKYSRPLAQWLLAHVREYSVVHVHAVFSHASMAAGRACLRCGVPFVVRPLGSLDPWSLGQRPLRKRLALAAGARRLLSGAAAMHYTTVEEQRLAESSVAGLPPGIVIPLGVDEALSPGRAARPAAHPYVLALSRLHEKKGLDLLIRAFRGIASAAVAWNWRLIIAGDGPGDHSARLRALAVGAANIEFRGWVDGDAKRDLLRGAAVVALPSQQENFGLGLVEAMACGIPVLATPGVNLAAEVASARAGWLVDRDVRAIGNALLEIMADGEERVRRGEAALQLAARYRWPAVAAELVALYSRLALSEAPA